MTLQNQLSLYSYIAATNMHGSNIFAQQDDKKTLTASYSLLMTEMYSVDHKENHEYTRNRTRVSYDYSYFPTVQHRHLINIFMQFYEA